MNSDTKLTKVYFKNFFGFIAIFIGATFMFSMPTELDESTREFDLSRGYGVASFIAVIYLGHMLAMKFVESEERDIKKSKK